MGAKNVITGPSFESYVNRSLLSMSTSYGKAEIENKRLATDGKFFSATVTGNSARLSVDISVTLTL